MGILNQNPRRLTILNNQRGNSGSQIGAVVGLAIGIAAVALAAPTGGASLAAYAAAASVGITVGSIAGSIIAPVKSKDDKQIPQGIKDFFITSAALGQMIPILKGAFRVPGNIIEATRKIERLVEIATPTSTPPSKLKGGGDDIAITEEKQYTITVAIALCVGPIQRIARIWTDLDLWYDESADLGRLKLVDFDENSVNYRGINGSCDTLVLYFGNETQEPDPTLETIHGVGKVSAHRGTAFIVLKDLYLGPSGRFPNFTFEAVRDQTYNDDLIDIAVGRNGLYVLYKKGLYNRRIGASFSVECDVAGPPDNTITRATGSFTNDGFVAGALTISGSGVGNDFQTEILTVSNTVLTVSDDLTVESNVTLTLAQPSDLTDVSSRAKGILVSYSNRTLERLQEQPTGGEPRHIGVINFGGMSLDFTAVVNAGVDGIDESSDTLSIFSSGINLDEFDLIADLRTSGEINNDEHFESNIIGTDGGAELFIGLDSIPAIVHYSVKYGQGGTGAGVVDRITLGTKATEIVFSPLGTLHGCIYVLSEGGFVYRITVLDLFNYPNLTLADTIPVPVGSNQGHIIHATSDDKIWVTSPRDDLVTHFTASSDDATVATAPSPGPLTEASDDYIWVGSTTSGAVTRIHHTAFTTQTFTLPNPIASMAPALNGKVWATTITGISASSVYLIDIDGTYILIRIPQGPEKVVSDTQGYAYIMCTIGRTVVVISPDASSYNIIASESGLACVVRDFSQMSGLNQEQIDVSGLDNSPVNMVLTEVQSAKNVIEQLQDAYNFTVTDSEGLLRYYFSANVEDLATIPENALSGGIDKEDTKSFSVARLQERELPTKVTVSYPNPLRNYQDSSESVFLTSSNIERNPQVIRLPIALLDTQAYTLAEIKLFEPWSTRERSQFTLPPSCMLLDPGDGVTITARSISYGMRIVEMLRARTWIHTVRAIGFQKDIYTSTIPTPATSGTGKIILKNPGRLAMILLDPPSINESDTTLHYFAVAYNTQPERDFTVATLFTSMDGGVNYAQVLSENVPSVLGTVAIAVNTGTPFVWDDTNIITVVMLEGTLSSDTDINILNGTNKAMYGNECIQWGTATLVAANTYQLTHILWGRRGTDTLVGLHSADEYFIPLNTPTIGNAVLYSPSILSVIETYKVVDPITSLAEATSFTQALFGNSVRPWAPVILAPVHNTPSTDDITIRWLYRSRLNGDSVLNTGVGISWDFDFTRKFYIFIFSDGTYSTVERTVLTDVYNDADAILTHPYTAAEQITDFGSLQSTIYFSITGLGSNVIGYGSSSSG